MLSVKKVKNSGKTTDYFAKDDYYASNDPAHQEFSAWYGNGALELGLTGNVTSESFLNILEGNLPNGQKIGVGTGTKKVHDAGRDLSFSAPKSVSIMALVYGDKRLIEAHNQAVRNTLDEIEKNYFKTRVKVDGQIYLEATGNMVSAIFQHELSRDLDPQLHSHAIVANATLGDNGKWRTGYFDDIYDNRNFLGTIYRSELAVLVKQLGYEINHKGKECLFELEAVPPSLIELFSKRAKKIRELAGLGATTKELQRATLLTRQTKKVKEHDHNLHHAWQQAANEHLSKERLTKFNPKFPPRLENELESELRNKAFIPSRYGTVAQEEIANKAVEFAIKHLSERKTVFTKAELITTALNDNLAKATHQDIEKSISNFIEAKELLASQEIKKEIKVNKNSEKNQISKETQVSKSSKNQENSAKTFTTSSLLTKENAIIELMVSGKNQHQPIAKDITKSKYLEILSDLNDGQKQSATAILSNKDLVMGVQGYAGVGKTHMLKAVNQIAQIEGYEIIGMSPTGVATINLEAKAEINSITLQKFLLQYDGVALGRGTKKGRLEMQQDFKNKIVVVDESSMISTTQMKNLLTIAKELNFKLILVGDRKQLDSVEAGVPFFELQRNGMTLVDMKEIFRQTNPNLKAAVYSTINRKIAQAFKQIEYDVIVANEANHKTNHKLGHKNLSGEELKTSLTDLAVKQFMILPSEIRQQTIILTPANETRQEVNAQISDLIFKERQQQNLEQKEQQNQTQNLNKPQEIYQNKNLTEAEKTRAYRFQVGNVLLFAKDRNYIGVKKNSYHQITKIDTKTNLITIKTGLFTSKTFNPISLKGKDEKIYFEAFKKAERIFRVGDKIAFSRSIPKLNIINADSGEITATSKSKISLRLKSGKSINLKKDSFEAKHLDYCYAVTAHKAQGLTCKNVIAICESYRKQLTTQKNFYVEISRAEERAIIITDNKQKVIEQLQATTGIEISARQHQGILSLRAQEMIKMQELAKELAKEKGETKEAVKETTTKPEPQLQPNKTDSASEETAQKEHQQAKPNQKYLALASILTEPEVKEHFLNAIKSGITLEAKDSGLAFDKAFANLGKKIRFGAKKEYEICWHGEAGYVKNYKTDEIVKWGINSIKFDDVNKNNFNSIKARFKELSSEEIAAKQQQTEQQRKQAEQQKLAEEKTAAIKARKYFERYAKLNLLNFAKNPYLNKKGLDHEIIANLKLTKDNRLVIPLHDVKGQIHSLHYINENGEKRFLAKAKKLGNFFMINSDKLNQEKTIYLAEGFATAATISIATKKPVAACFDAGNIEHVLKNLKETHPNKEFIIAGDNDQWKEKNVGKEKAELAAKKYGAKVILPQFSQSHKDKMPTDFNDLHKLEGISQVVKQLNQHQAQQHQAQRQIQQTQQHANLEHQRQQQHQNQEQSQRQAQEQTQNHHQINL